MIRNPYSTSNNQAFNQGSAPSSRWVPLQSVTLRQIDSNHQAMIQITRGYNGRMRSISTCVLSGQNGI